MSVTDERMSLGLFTVETSDWKLVFSEQYNWGVQQWYDLAYDPGESDNLATGGANTGYSSGVLFDYDIYLGAGGGVENEFMTTMGPNVSPGAAQLDVLESNPVRVRLKQSGHPLLNNGRGPAGNPFPELELVSFVTYWTIYANGKIHIDFETTINESEKTVASGPGSGGAGIDFIGTTITATGGTDFVALGVFEGDTIESTAGGFGPVLVTSRVGTNQLTVDQSIGSASDVDFLVRRENIFNETVSLHADGDVTIINQCSDPALSRWQGGSNGDTLWDSLVGGCFSLIHSPGGAAVGSDYVLAHWTRSRGAGMLLAQYDFWSEANYGAFNDQGFTDISYTQWGRSTGLRPIVTHDRQYLLQLGSSSSTELPTIKSVSDSLPFSHDYGNPYAQALIGTLATGGEIPSYGFNTSFGHYELAASSGTAAIQFDTNGSTRLATGYQTPAVLITNVAEVSLMQVELSTDASNSYTTLSSTSYNLARADADSWLFHYLEEIPGTATGINAYAFRFTQKTLSPVWVEFDHSGDECGTQDNPFNSLTEGIAAAADAAIVNIVSDQTSETISINQNVRLQASGGTVTIGLSP
ncbi:MAG: hypothetical protein VCD00_14365 [Candidatus Hydrogenedentota bacterium]